ncbi:MAG: transglycosylase SLT domain-containing protein [Pseudomonadota bacterium]
MAFLTPEFEARPVERPAYRPRARWDRQRDGYLWTRATMSAVLAHGKPLVEMVPGDIADWCPAYPTQDVERRAAFWTGMISALVKHESTFRPRVVGGGGKWVGLTQILPATARGYGCRARTRDALKNGPANLSCAVRIMAVTVPRDGVVARKNGKSAGVAADWGPMVFRAKRSEMQAFTRAQSYCRLLSSVRPAERP